MGYYTNSACSSDQPGSMHNAYSSTAQHSCSSLEYMESSLKQAQEVHNHFGKYVDKKKHKKDNQLHHKLPPTTERNTSVHCNYVTNVYIYGGRVSMDSKG